MVDLSGQIPFLDKPAFNERLSDLLKAQSVRHIPGARLAPLISQALGGGQTFRDFLPAGEPSRLSSFVDRFVAPEVLLPTSLRKGSDYLFEVVDFSEPAMAALSQRGQLWRSFVSIDPRSKMVFDSATVTVKVLPSQIETPSGCVEIAPVTLVEHGEMCRSFATELQREGVAVPGLDTVLENFDQSSYPQWLKALRAVRPLDRRWGEFRHAALLDLFSQRLKEAGVRADRVPELQAELARDHNAARLPSKAVEPSVDASSAPRGGDDREKRARELLRMAADKLPLEQLQAIQLPIAAILDLLGDRA